MQTFMYSHSLYMFFFALLILMASHTNGFVEQDEALFLSLFPQLINATYVTPYPSASFASSCPLGPGKTGKLTYATLKRVTLPQTTTASQAQKLCDTSTLCIVPAQGTLTMDSNLVVGMLQVNGKLIWNDETQTEEIQWICAGSVVAAGGLIDINLTGKDLQKRAFIYIQNNGVADPVVGYRVFGGYQNASIYVQGRPMVRTWSLLATTANIGASSISLMHDPVAMGWLVGDRIQIAPTTTGSNGYVESYYIGSFGATGTNTINLAKDASLKTPAVLTQVFKARFLYVGDDRTAEMSAEVINLSRNVIITGDDFENVHCVDPSKSKQEGDCLCDNRVPRTVCTLGLHTILSGPGIIQMKYIRIEKCGQRAILGRYCQHFHYVGVCPDCIFEGNAIETSMQRGSEVHETMLSTVINNVYTGVRGALVYIEDGNEIYNWILYNVAICPWPLNGKLANLHGCTIPGTFDGQADTSLNQAGFWGDSFQNYFIGNRASNNFNGMLWMAQGLEGGRGGVRGKECLNNQLIGRMEGNTFHGSGRFGTYFLVSVFPKYTDRTLSRNATVTLSSCAALDAMGNDRGAPQSVYRHVDYDNVFVGQYGLGDVNYINHISISNLNLIYWKETKNFADDCTSHLLNSYYENGNMALPSGHGTFIMENITFSGKVSFENDHHCGVGVTGILCMPTYVLANVRLQNPDTTRNWIHWGINNGAMLTLSPPECLKPNGNFFPVGYCSLVNPYWTYLLALDGGTTCLTSAQVSKQTGIPYLDTIFTSGILCRLPVRRLEVYSFKQKIGMKPPPLLLQLYQKGKLISSQNVPYFQIGDDGSNTRKQGYAMTVVTGLSQSYKLSFLNGSGIPSDWIIEFSDTIFGNRWGPDEIDLTVVGRKCQSPVTSQHDRLFIWGDSNGNYLNVPGRGACTNFPDKPRVDCSTVPKMYLEEKCPQCSGVNCGPNGYCDCGTKKCQCESGFSGPNCENDICANSGCDPNTGACTMRYLGGTLPATLVQCACKAGSFGNQCNANPCLKVDCGSHGTCTIISAINAVCTCNDNWDGPTCNNFCGNSTKIPKCDPPCMLGIRYYVDSDFTGANIDAEPTETKEDCGSLCIARKDCNGFAWNGVCYLKSNGKVTIQKGVWAGMKCTTEPLQLPSESSLLY